MAASPPDHGSGAQDTGHSGAQEARTTVQGPRCTVDGNAYTVRVIQPEGPGVTT